MKKLSKNAYFGGISRAMNRFFANRAPRADILTLGLKNVYIFFSRQGFLFAVLLITTFVTGVNYGNNLVLGLFFYLFGIWLVAIFYTFIQVSSLTLKIMDVSMAAAGSLAWVTVEVSTRSGKPSRQIQLQFDENSDEVLSKLTASDAHEYKKHHKAVLVKVDAATLVRLPVYADSRGRHILPRMVLSSTYPIGVLRAWSFAYFARPMFIYPAPLSFDWQGNKYAVQADDGEQQGANVAGRSDFEMLDEYKQGESLARVSWAHVARGAGMMTKHFADPIGREWRLSYFDMPGATHENKLGELSYALEQIASLETPFALYLPSGQGQVGVGMEFIKQCKMRLALEP